jgi:sterol desaturase/sphingolipid hydroxylase (fatty acid hydroxylase superfamily)
MALELWLPRRAQTRSRWASNILVSVVNIAVLRFIMPITAVGAAIYASNTHFGLFNQLNTPLNGLFAIILLDLAIYTQHVLSHKFSPLWAFHKMHHSDTEVDTTTGIRFHAGEAMLSMAYKAAIVMLLGVSPFVVMIYEVILNACSLFSHANIKLPFDRMLSKIIVTPDMHRIHHSVHRHETDSNYGNFLSVWDRLFKTYIETPQDGHEAMQLGLPEFRGEKRLDQLLTQPFRKT